MADERGNMTEIRSRVIHVRVKPALDRLLERDAKSVYTTKSELIRTILVKHYRGEE